MRQSICTVDNCERPIHIKKRGLCQPHYMWHWKHGTIEGFMEKPATRACGNCGETFAPHHVQSNYCSELCKHQAAWGRLKADGEKYGALKARKRDAYVPREQKPRARNERGCEVDGCANPHRARGRCATHYNRTLTNRRPKVEKTCDCCGATCMKDPHDRRARSVYCSNLCKFYAQWGGSSSRLPMDHPARWFGATCEWKPSVRDVNCAWCDETFRAKSTAARFCSKRCLSKMKRVVRRGREHGAPGTYSHAQMVKLWMKFDKCCAYCREHVDLTDLQAEHVVPLSRGGANNTTNLLPSCAMCNADKRDLLLSEWNADRKRRGLKPRITTWHSSDRLYSHLVITGDLKLAA